MTVTKKSIAAVMLLAFAGIGCESSHEDGVTSDLHSQWTMVSADTQTTTQAAKDVLMESKLMDVDSKSTNMDGMAMGKMADGSEVKVSVAQAPKGSQVSVTVGTLGSPTMGADIAMKIKQKAEAASGTNK